MRYGLHLAIGQQGSGKTLFITKLLIDILKKDKNIRVFSNYTLFGIKYTKITLSRALENNPEYLLKMLEKDPNYFNNSIILLDEIHLDLDSRDFFKKNSRQLQSFFSQLRKRKILLLATTQYILNLDIRVRRQALHVFEMSHIKGDIFKVVTHKIDGYFTEEISSYFVELCDYYHFYDTNEIIL